MSAVLCLRQEIDRISTVRRNKRRNEVRLAVAPLSSMRRGKPILAVYEDDLDSFLEDLGMIERLRAGMPCEICGVNVTRENLGYIFFIDQQPKLCCDNTACYYELMRTAMSR